MFPSIVDRTKLSGMMVGMDEKNGDVGDEAWSKRRKSVKYPITEKDSDSGDDAQNKRGGRWHSFFIHRLGSKPWYEGLNPTCLGDCFTVSGMSVPDVLTDGVGLQLRGCLAKSTSASYLSFFSSSVAR